MKFLKKAVVIAAAGLLVVPFAASAQFGQYDTGGTDYQSVSTDSGMTTSSVGQILVNIMNWFMMILGIGAIISFVIAGIMYLTAAGDEGKTEKAKNLMVYAIIALVVALVGYVIVNTVVNLTGSGAGDSISY